MLRNLKNLSNQSSEPINENFCGACVAVPLALMGATASNLKFGGDKHKFLEKNKYKKEKTIALVIGIVVSCIVFAYGLNKLKTCSECS